MKITFIKSCFLHGRDAALRCPVGTARRPYLFLFSLVLGLFLTGCLSRPALQHQAFALQTPAVTNMPATGSVLLFQPVEVSPLFAGQALVYRIGPNAYETDPYAGFLVSPARALAIPIRAYLANSGAFANVVEPGNPLAPTQELRVQVGELYGDFRRPGHPAAVLSLRFEFVSAGGNVIRQKQYSRSVPLKINTAPAVVAGYDEALAGIMADVAADLAAK
ncbi:MAG TPA: ABC-type transport auxiliary lipoprotein family protein [Candidatus Acidoferrum sp.]|nr:ABC-type transport auxiliary lipoprotein family protein [Candidatus Acidoferrum sp.]